MSWEEMNEQHRWPGETDEQFKKRLLCGIEGKDFYKELYIDPHSYCRTLRLNCLKTEKLYLEKELAYVNGLIEELEIVKNKRAKQNEKLNGEEK